MTVDNCLKKAKSYIGIDRRLLLCKISEVYTKHSQNEKLTDEEKFFIGLRYSEFLAESDTNEAYVQAGIKRDAILNILGIDIRWLIDSCATVCGLY